MKLRIATMIALSSLLTMAPASYSINFDEILRNYLGGARTGSSDISPSEQAIIKTNINTRQAQLETQVQAGVSSGQLSSEEEADLTAELNRIAALEGSYLADGSYNRAEVTSMLDELNNFSSKLQTYLSNATTRNNSNNRRDWYHRYLTGPQDGNLNRRAFQADIDTKQAQIDAAITGGINSGQLGWSESRTLRAGLNQIAQKENEFTADGRLSYSEGKELIAQLDALNTKVTQSLAAPRWNRGTHGNRGRYGSSRRSGSSSAINSHQSLLRQRINQGMSSGALTKSDGYRLLSEEARIDELEQRLHSNDGKLSFDEQKRLFNELDNLNRKINKELADRRVQ